MKNTIVILSSIFLMLGTFSCTETEDVEILETQNESSLTPFDTGGGDGENGDGDTN